MDVSRSRSTPGTVSKMGTGKKEANRRERQGKTSDAMSNIKVKGENFYRWVKAATKFSNGC